MGTLHSSKLQHYWNLNIRLFSVMFRTLVEWESYTSADMQSVYSAASTDRASVTKLVIKNSESQIIIFSSTEDLQIIFIQWGIGLKIIFSLRLRILNFKSIALIKITLLWGVFHPHTQQHTHTHTHTHTYIYI